MRTLHTGIELNNMGVRLFHHAFQTHYLTFQTRVKCNLFCPIFKACLGKIETYRMRSEVV